MAEPRAPYRLDHVPPNHEPSTQDMSRARSDVSESLTWERATTPFAMDDDGEVSAIAFRHDDAGSQLPKPADGSSDDWR